MLLNAPQMHCTEYPGRVQYGLVEQRVADPDQPITGIALPNIKSIQAFGLRKAASIVKDLLHPGYALFLLL